MVKLVWATLEAEKNILYCARVSSNDQTSTDTRLLKYLVKHHHWSPFEMANMCLEIVTTRDVSAQILRHRSFSFQEFSQRYAEATEFVNTLPRRQDVKNRQNSIDDLDEEILKWWAVKYNDLAATTQAFYKEALSKGISKESARRILPMATQTKLYMNGTLRSWMHYFQLRCDVATQKEHRDIANAAKEIFKQQFPVLGALL